MQPTNQSIKGRSDKNVSILTRPEGRVQRGQICFLHVDMEGVSILTRPEGRVQPLCRRATAGRPQSHVSILTRPEGRVQRPSERSEPVSVRVSILTRPEGRVQRDKLQTKRTFNA